MYFKRGESKIRNWWWNIDSSLFMMVVSLLIIGAILVTTASPVVAQKLSLSYFFFSSRHLFYVTLAIAIIIATSNIKTEHIKKISLIGFFITLILLAYTPFAGESIKGAKRWLSVFGFSLQPSEILKPLYVVIIGMILVEKENNPHFPSFKICTLLHIIIIALLLLQPDIGMSITISIVFAYQLFLAGLNMLWVLILLLSGIMALLIAYVSFPHVADRINDFLNPSHVSYQVEKSLQAYHNGGVFGVGLGNGTAKNYIPDVHADFIFSAVGEEFGMVGAIALLCLMFGIFFRGMYFVMRSKDKFNIYVSSAILMYYILQTIFNIGVTLNIFPTKGMTLPLVSYGGSSILAFAIGFGLVLSIGRKEYKTRRYNYYVEQIH